MPTTVKAGPRFVRVLLEVYKYAGLVTLPPSFKVTDAALAEIQRKLEAKFVGNNPCLYLKVTAHGDTVLSIRADSIYGRMPPIKMMMLDVLADLSSSDVYIPHQAEPNRDIIVVLALQQTPVSARREGLRVWVYSPVPPRLIEEIKRSITGCGVTLIHEPGQTSFRLVHSSRLSYYWWCAYGEERFRRIVCQVVRSMYREHLERTSLRFTSVPPEGVRYASAQSRSHSGRLSQVLATLMRRLNLPPGC